MVYSTKTLYKHSSDPLLPHLLLVVLLDTHVRGQVNIEQGIKQDNSSNLANKTRGCFLRKDTPNFN